MRRLTGGKPALRLGEMPDYLTPALGLCRLPTPWVISAALTIFGIVPHGNTCQDSLMRSLLVSAASRFLKDESGQDLIEYTLLVAFIAVASAGIYMDAGANVSSIWSSASVQLSNAATSAS